MLKSILWLGPVLALAGICTLPALASEADAPKADGPMRAARPAFSAIDTNKDGMISQAEFEAFHPEKPGGDRDGPPPSDGHWRHRDDRGGVMPFHGPDLKRLDTDKDGKVSLEEFIAPMKAHFARIDANKDGFLDETELKAPPPPPPPEGGPDSDVPPPEK